MARRTVRSFDPDAPDPGWSGGEDPVAHGGADRRRPARLGDRPRDPTPPAEVWIDPFDPVGYDAAAEWHDADDVVDDTPTARADRAYGRAVDPATPTAALRAVAADLVTWDVEALLREAAVHAGVVDAGPVPVGDRPEVVVLRALLRHPNRPEDLADVVLGGWLEDPTTRSPWSAVVAVGTDAPVDPDRLVTAVVEATDAARGDEPPAWSLLLPAAAAGRADGSDVLDLVALTGFPHEQPARLWPDAEAAARGLPGGVRAQARRGAELLGWDGRRLPGLAPAVATAVHAADRRRRDTSFAATLELCPHGPVVVTPTAVTLPAGAAGPRPYVALIVGSHPVFRLKRDWPDRDGGGAGTVWSWSGPTVLETRGLGCDACRRDTDRGKRYLVATDRDVGEVRLSDVQRAVERLEQP